MKIRLSQSFLRGYSKALDLYGITKKWPDISNSRQKDFNALRRDWIDVGNTIRKETGNFRRAGY